MCENLKDATYRIAALARVAMWIAKAKDKVGRYEFEKMVICNPIALYNAGLMFGVRFV